MLDIKIPIKSINKSPNNISFVEFVMESIGTRMSFVVISVISSIITTIADSIDNATIYNIAFLSIRPLIVSNPITTPIEPNTNPPIVANIPTSTPNDEYGNCLAVSITVIVIFPVSHHTTHTALGSINRLPIAMPIDPDINPPINNKIPNAAIVPRIRIIALTIGGEESCPDAGNLTGGGWTTGVSISVSGGVTSGAGIVVAGDSVS